MTPSLHAPVIHQATDPGQLARQAAAFVEATLEGVASPTVLLATGSSPLGLYRELANNPASAMRSAELRAFALDEYCGLEPGHPQSFRQRLLESVIEPLGLTPQQLHTPEGMAESPEDEALRYGERLHAAGTVHLAIVGVGINGHIAFNEPGTSFDSDTHVVSLTDETKSANARAFGGDPTAVPTHAITVGIATLLRVETIVLVASGAEKAPAIDMLLRAKSTPAWPVTALLSHPRVHLFADTEALGAHHSR